MCFQKDTAFLGELALDGTLRSVRGVLPSVLSLRDKGFSHIIVPQENVREAALVDGVSVYGAHTLGSVVAHIQKTNVIERTPTTIVRCRGKQNVIDFSDIAGQETAKRGVEIAAAGRHNVAFGRPAGTGKTMLAQALSGILPALSLEEGLEATAIHSLAGALSHDAPVVTTPPFRSPHHTSSYVSLVGGGATIRPGEVTLATPRRIVHG